MMGDLATYAIIDSKTNLVVTRVWWNGDTTLWTPPDDTYAALVLNPEDGGVGDSYNPVKGKFTKAE